MRAIRHLNALPTCMAPTASRPSASNRRSAQAGGSAPKEVGRGGAPKKDEEAQYRLKAKFLQEKMDHIVKNNNILRNRLYHVRKEINYLKRLKRVLWQRLIFHGETCFIESELEIPDKPENEGVPSSFDKVMNEVASFPGPPPKRRRGETKKAAAALANAKQEDGMSQRISQIIDGILTEVHSERLASRGQRAQPKATSNSIRVMSPHMEEHMLRASSCDKELPEGPD
ncbi:hypothetical protein L596_023671 [Steinernema carpocapsae]|uniref:Uncharacterized protein n=3 Tax=Steinernema carpocapsae TaxID=34508 RepID=A0A4U5MEC0_STECR|nr:hypothetical protein L596_023671 [Steinernema carpocapsae]